MPSLAELALEIAASSLGDTLPFVLLAGVQGMKNLTIVTDRSDRALSLGRRMVRQQAEGATEYVIVVDVFVDLVRERSDALLVEVGAAGNDTAHVTAYRYRRGDKPELFGEPILYEKRPSSLVRLDPFTLDWNAITPDLYNKEDKHAVHIVNHDLESADNVARTVRFLRARARYFARHLPADGKQTAFVDVRGQRVSPAHREMLARGLAGALGLKYIEEKGAR